MAEMMVKRLLAVTFALGIGLTVGSCSSFSDVVADSWPHFAGGEPKGLPPRPGDPGYNKFIAHGQSQQGAETSPGNQPAGETAAIGNPKPGAAAQTSTAFTEQQNQQPGFQVPPAAPGPNASSVSGGLY